MDQRYFARSLEGRPEAEWQSLDQHLRGVAAAAWAHGLRSTFSVWRSARLAGEWCCQSIF